MIVLLGHVRRQIGHAAGLFQQNIPQRLRLIVGRLKQDLNPRPFGESMLIIQCNRAVHTSAGMMIFLSQR